MNYEQFLGKTVENDERFVVLTAENRAAIRNLPARLGARFIDTGITEQALVGVAAGLALRGRIPIVHALASFLTMRAFEFIRTDIGIAHLPVKLVGYIPGLLSTANGPTHQALEDVALMRGIPGMGVFCPGDIEDMLIGLPEILHDPHPWYVRFNDQKADIFHQPESASGRAEMIFAGHDLTLLTYGFLLPQACAAARLLRARGVSVRLLNLRTLEPLDEAAILAAVCETRMLITVEDHFMRGGLFSALAELLAKHRLACEILPIAFAKRWFKPALLSEVLAHEGLTGEKIADRILTEYAAVRNIAGMPSAPAPSVCG